MLFVKGVVELYSWDRPLENTVFLYKKANVQLHLVIDALLHRCLHLRYKTKAELCLVVKIF